MGEVFVGAGEVRGDVFKAEGEGLQVRGGFLGGFDQAQRVVSVHG